MDRTIPIEKWSQIIIFLEMIKYIRIYVIICASTKFSGTNHNRDKLNR